MAKTNPEVEKAVNLGIGFALAITAVNVYYHTYGFWADMGARSNITDIWLESLSPILENPLASKLWCLAIAMLCSIVRVGKRTKAGWPEIIFYLAAGIALYLFPFKNSILYIAGSLGGITLAITGTNLAVRKIAGMREPVNDINETFLQCDEKIETNMSVNIPTEYIHKGKKHNGWINIVQPQRGSIVLGLPGSGKSYVFYSEMMRQMVAKGFTGMVYDFKYPTLTEEMYNVIDLYGPKKNKPKFFVINFDNVRYSNRCNPMSPKYITSPADTAEIAELIFLNIKKNTKGTDDFFDKSGKLYIDMAAYLLYLYKDGIYCDFPHLVELLSRSYERVFRIMENEPRLRAKIASFKEALEGGAQDQLQGQVASARIPVAMFVSPELYYILSGDDFNCDLNNPEDPKILCIGNNPDRQAIYGASLALITSRIFRRMNKPHMLPSFVMLDEFPTIYLKGIDTVIATARSNKVCVVLGAQDKSQIERDYSKEEAKVIFSTPANLFSGPVQGETAKELAQEFGKEKRRQESETQSTDSESLNISFHDEERMPINKITNLSVGYFFGRVADDIKHPIAQKDFCAKCIIDNEKRSREQKAFKPLPVIREKEFNEALIIEKNMENECAIPIRAYIRSKRQEFVQEILTETNASNTGKTISEDELEMLIYKKGEELKNKINSNPIQKSKIVKEYIDKRIKENETAVINRHFDRIISEIDQLLAELDPEGEDPGELRNNQINNEEISN